VRRPSLRLRNILPKGLYWRTILIILVPAAILQLIVTLVFLDDHWRATSKRMSQGVAADVALLIQLYERDPTPQNFNDLQRYARDPLRLELTLDRSGPVEQTRCRNFESVSDFYLTRELQQSLDRRVFYDPTCPGSLVIIRVPTGEGVLQVTAFRDRVQARSGPLFVAWIFCATLFLAVVSVIFIRNQVRPIETLADAMERFGRGDEAPMFKVRGAREIRGATLAFFDMRARIRKHIEQRAQLLAGVSHDLRTPLTRLKLQFALMPKSEELEDAKRDLAEMEATLEEYLAFARGAADETPETIDLSALVNEIAAEQIRSGVPLETHTPEPASIAGRARALKRCLINLIDNAIAHGEKVRVTTRSAPDAISVIVEDDGPGIPHALYEEAFKPFSRLDETRSRNQKGVGLGLAIARDVARAHGGDVNLAKSDLGGLKATLRFPRPA
jgi:two-component system osmolarity sensor histidine kinase EnvZ